MLKTPTPLPLTSISVLCHAILTVLHGALQTNSETICNNLKENHSMWATNLFLIYMGL
jgi:hypothetical protein